MVGLARTHDPVQSAQMGLVSASIIIEGYGALFGLTHSTNEAANRLKTIQKQMRG